MATGAVNGVRVALLLLGAGAVAGGYALWQARQPAAVTDTARPDAEQVAADVPQAVADPAGEPVAAPAAEPAVEPVIAEPAIPEPAAAVPPTFDVVRIDPDGAALIAGTAAPDARVSLRLDGVEETRVQADRAGAFVAQFTLAPNPAPRLLSMVVVLPDGTEIAADETVAVAPIAAPVPLATDAPAPQAPAAILLSDDGAEVIQGPTPVVAGEKVEVALDTIAYAPDGAVQLSGRGQGGSALRIYLDNAAVMDTQAGNDGKWAVTLPETVPGIYTLRIDQLAADGAVTSRFETPFKRETLGALAAATGAVAVPTPDSVAENVVVAEAAPQVAAVPAPAAAEQTPAQSPDAVAEVEAAPELAVVAEVEPAPEPAVEPAPVPDVVPSAEPAPVPQEALPDPVAVAAPGIDPIVPEPVLAPVTITVQPGFTLWGIATERFGEGTMYVQVFEANRDAIRDPDLIYPGQVFILPQE